MPIAWDHATLFDHEQFMAKESTDHPLCLSCWKEGSYSHERAQAQQSCVNMKSLQLSLYEASEHAEALDLMQCNLPAFARVSCLMSQSFRPQHGLMPVAANPDAGASNLQVLT